MRRNVPFETAPTKSRVVRAAYRRLKDTVTEDGACLRRVSGGSDVSGSPTRFYIAFSQLDSRARDSGNDRPINKSSILKCCGRTLISLTERSAPGSFASCINTITASVVGRMPVNRGIADRLRQIGPLVSQPPRRCEIRSVGVYRLKSWRHLSRCDIRARDERSVTSIR